MISGFKDTTRHISNMGTTTVKLTNRGGLALILRYMEQTGFFDLVKKNLKSIPCNAKSLPLVAIVRQILAFFIDGTSKSISSFDRLLCDDGYAATLEVASKDLVSSHRVKRFFRKFSFARCAVLRWILNKLFLWRLTVSQPKVIVLDIDTMVLDNDDANCRQGVSPTYKKKKGFQNLQITWNNRIVDAIFRRGSAHSNHGNDVLDSLKRVTKQIRLNYSESVPVIVTMDSGFLDEKTLYALDKLDIAFICFGKLYDTVTGYVKQACQSEFSTCTTDRKMWNYIEFGSRLKSWKTIGFLRTIYTSCVENDDGQMLLGFARPDSVLYTNIGINPVLTQQLTTVNAQEYVSTEGILHLAHGRGVSELTNRSLKDFMTSEKLPFKGFGMNAAYYYLQAIGQFMLQSFNEDVVKDAVPGIVAASYPTTLRRRIIDIAAVIVKTSRIIKLKISTATHSIINASLLWQRCCGQGLVPISLKL